MGSRLYLTFDDLLDPPAPPPRLPPPTPEKKNLKRVETRPIVCPTVEDGPK